MNRNLLILIGAVPLLAAPQAGKKFVPLFDGKTLSGWEVCNGFAKYRVEDGAIVGTTAEGSPNSFLCTTKEYGDFVLEFETKTEPALNSGVQIRSHRFTGGQTVLTFNGKQLAERKTVTGRVHAYQVEIANEESGTSGGIYDESRRGWLHNIASDAAASKAFKDNQWNRYRVAAIGDSIKTWVNGVPCADLVDSMDLTGFIALQVHSYKGPKPAEVRWRNIRIQDLGRHAWKRVWDGRTLNGWTKTGGGAWTIEDGALRGVSIKGDERSGFVISDAAFQNLTTRLKFRILKGNSGYFVRADRKTMAGYEIEIDDTKGSGGYWEVGGRRWVTGPEDNAACKPGDWNELTGSLHGRRIVFHVNGVKTMEILNDAEGKIDGGHLALQVHGRRDSEVWFKDIEVLEPVK
jgi:hypothetical protein